MDRYHQGLVNILERMSYDERAELALSITVVLGVETKKIKECFTKDASGKTFFSATPFPLGLVTEVYCINAPNVMQTLEKLSLSKYWKNTA